MVSFFVDSEPLGRARERVIGLLAVAVFTLASSSAAGREQVSGGVDSAAIGTTDQAGEVWLSHGKTYGEQHYSPLRQINAGNVGQLGEAWEADLESPRFGIEATPIVVGGIVFTTSSYGRVFAFDAATGRRLWAFDPKVPADWLLNGCCKPANRGVGIWKGKLFVATYDGRLIALDAQSGRKLWEVNTTEGRKHYTITGAPLVANGKVIIGNGGADLGTRGYLSAYDSDSGKMMWRFFVVPDGPRQSFETPELAMAIKTWSSEHDWSFGGGGNPWNAISYDADEDLVYVGTGNGPTEGQPARNVGTGAHLFASCILAINATTGRLVWYYQTTPGDEWDYDATENLVLANLRIRGRSRHVVMQANKNGFYYVLDRSTGQLLAADNFVPVNWASGVNPTTGKPNVLLKNADWRESVKLVFPGEYGAHNWMAMAFDPIAGLAFIPAQDIGWIEGADPEAYFYMGYDTKTLTGSDQPPRAHGELIAWDPVTRTARWRVVLTTIINGGVLATAGDLVVQGTSDGYIRVYESKSGRLLKQISIGTGIVAPPISYAVNGVQYIAVCAGWSGWQTEVPPPDSPAPYSNAGRIIVLRLKGGPVAMAQRVPLAPYLAIATPQRPPVVAKGKSLYAANCGSCHTVYGEGSVYPDLRRMSVAAYANFHQIVLNGLLRDGGMASFAGVLSSDDVEAIKAYIVDWSQRSAAKKTVH